NDLGRMVGSYRQDQCILKMFILDPEKGVQLVSQKKKSLNPIKINNANEILADSDSIWSESSGFSSLEIPEGFYIQCLELNDHGQIIGSYRQKGASDCRPFKWDNGKVFDLGPGSDFAKGFDDIGLYPIKIEVKDINNQGHIVGKVHYGKYNELTGKYVKVGCCNFFWNESFHLIKISNCGIFETMKLNEEDDVLLCDGSSKYQTFIWNLKSNLQKVDRFRGIDFNDHRIIIGFAQVEQKGGQLKIVPGVFVNDKTYTIAELLGVDDVKWLTTPYSDHYEAEKLIRLVAINNMDQIAAECTVWDDIYPCILQLKDLEK
ncbi:MAG: hypothetical protein ACK5MA_02015, partial [Parachlamydiaceae bacterium]